MTYRLEITSSTQPQDLIALRRNLAQSNVRRVPALLSLPRGDYGAFIRDAQGRIVGGAVGELDWGWLYVDLLWVAEPYRGRGYGSRLMQAMEYVAYSNGLPQVYLATTSFQALPFYQKLGYDVWAMLDDRPKGYAYYYLRRQHIKHPPLPDVELVKDPPKADVKAVRQGLIAYSEQFVHTVPHRIAIFARPPSGQAGDGQILAGLYGVVAWDWFDLQYLWVEEALRGHGVASQMLEMAKAQAARYGVRRIVTDTADFQALPFYQRHGFTTFGTLPDRPPGYISHFLKYDEGEANVRNY